MKTYLVICLLIFALDLAGPARAKDGTTSFGFTGPEIFPIDVGIGNLRAADLDGDGLTDLVIVNNLRSKITFLYNQTGRTNQVSSAGAVKRELNELPPDARFRIDSIASEKRIESLAVTDLNHDGKPDLAYYGEPKELVVQYNLGGEEWSTPKRWAIEDALLTPNAMTTGDINGDHLTDLILLGENNLYLLAQTPDHALGEPVKIPYSGTLKSVQILDINGDRLNDLLLVNWDSLDPFRFRLQSGAGQLGPEIHFAMPPIRSYWADDLDGDGKTEVITIAQNSGRAQISNFAKKPSEPLAGGFRSGQFQVLPLNKTGKAKRAITWADLNGDHLPDLIVSEPDSGQLTVYVQQPDGSLPLAKTFPSLTGVSDVAVIGGGKENPAEIYLLSQDERQVGMTHYEKDGRVPFPSPLALEGKPLALATGPLEAKAKPSLAVILDQNGAKVLWLRRPDGRSQSQKLSENFRSNPSSLAFHDVDQDGLADLVILIPYEKIKILLQRAGQDFEEVDIAPPGGSQEQPWMSSADVDGDGKPELLLAQKNFVRAVVIRSEEKKDQDARPAWTFTVKDQINGASGNSRIVGAAPLPQEKKSVPALFLFDAERKVLSLCERDKEGVWQIVRSLPLPYSDFNAIEPVALGSALPNSVAFTGLNALGWITLTGDAWEFVELDGYETPIKDGRLYDVVSGDLNQDGRKDLVFLETAKNYLDLVIFDPDGKLTPANRWQVFEERTFRSRRPADVSEPREALIVDLTGDGKNDLAVVVHDRILVYPQE
jgi:FG-GAP-like repeat